MFFKLYKKVTLRQAKSALSGYIKAGKFMRRVGKMGEVLLVVAEMYEDLPERLEACKSFKEAMSVYTLDEIHLKIKASNFEEIFTAHMRSE